VAAPGIGAFQNNKSKAKPMMEEIQIPMTTTYQSRRRGQHLVVDSRGAFLAPGEIGSPSRIGSTA
jgi:hypothetical protein